MQLFQDWREKKGERNFRKTLLACGLPLPIPLPKTPFFPKASQTGMLPFLCAYKDSEINRAEADASRRLTVCRRAASRNSNRG